MSDFHHGLSGSGFNIYSVYVADGGREVGEWPNAPYQFADGMTVLYCNGGTIRDSIFENNSDFGLVLGGGPNCNVHHNTIRQTTRFAFAGLNLGKFDGGTGGVWDGRHDGSSYYANAVSSSYNQMMYGLSAGSHPFIPPQMAQSRVENMGTLASNDSTGAQINLVVDGVTAGSVSGNTFSNPQGNRTEFNSCAYSGNYTAAHASFTPQAGWDRIFFDYGICQRY